ncbi:21793_t:CDS:2, partial [Gigaspora rosea]
REKIFATLHKTLNGKVNQPTTSFSTYLNWNFDNSGCSLD